MSLRATASLTTILALGAWACPGAAAQSKEETVDLGSGITLELVWIPAGTFMMGAQHPFIEEGGSHERPQHEVTLSAGFWMGKYEVTQEQWASVMGNNPSDPKGRKLPVHRVSWDDCQEFVQRLSDKVGGKEFRLPTEAEWEYACRAGSKTTYHFGDDPGNRYLVIGDGSGRPTADRLGEYAWYLHNSNSMQPVGQKKPNAWALYDMHGNVSEWCQDWYGPYAYENELFNEGAAKQTDPKGAASSSDGRVYRDGCYSSSADGCRAATRYSSPPDERAWNIGFRIAR